MNVGKNLMYFMEKRNISKYELSKMLDVAPSTITNWCTNRTQIRTKYYDKLYKILGCTEKELFSLELQETFNKIPILGSICAGNGIICENDYQGMFYADSSIKADYCLRVKGNSMYPEFKTGDIAFIRKDYEFTDGNTYAVLLGEEVMLKNVFIENDMYCLTSFNPQYQPLYVKDLFIIGKCIGHYSSLS